MKKISRRSFLMATGVIAASAALSACGGSSASTSSAGSTAASTAASGSAAQGGGDLVIYSPNSEGLLNATIPLFEEKYGVNVELIQAGTGELVKRIQSEKNDPYADVLFGGSWSQMYTNEDLWEPYVSANDANVIDAYKNKCGFITGNVLDGSVLIVNTDLIGDIKIEGYEDLLNPALKGKIATADPANSSSAFAHLTNMLLAMGGYEDDKAWQYVHDLFENVDGKICESSSGVYKGVADGEYVVGLSYEDPCAQLVLDGAPVKIVYMKEGTVFLPASATIIKGAKNMLIMVVALIIRRLPYTIRSSVAILQQIPMSIEEAAISLGASKMKAFFRITVPMMASGIISGAILSWVTMISELSTAIILYTGKTKTLTVAIYTEVIRGNYGTAAALSTIMTILTVISLLAFSKLNGGKDISL